MTDVQKLKTLAEAAGGVSWSWWTSNSFLRLTTELDGRHGSDGDAISAYRDSVQCPDGIKAFIEAANPAAVLRLIAKFEFLREGAGSLDGVLTITERSRVEALAELRKCQAELTKLKAENKALRKGLQS